MGSTVGPKRGVWLSQCWARKGGGTYFGKARDPKGIGVCQTGIGAGSRTVHPKLCNLHSVPFLAPGLRREGPAKGGVELEGGRTSGEEGRDQEKGAGLGAVFVLENPTAPRGGAAPPAPAWEGGAARPPGRPWGV